MFRYRTSPYTYTYRYIHIYIYISLDRCIGALRDTGFLAPLYLRNRGALHPIEKKGKRERKKEEGEGEGKEKEKLVPQHVARLDARETIRGSGINCRRIGVRAMSDEALIGEPTWPRLATIGNDIVPPFSYVHTYTYFTYREREREREVDSFSMKKATFDKRARQYRDTPSTILLLLLLSLHRGFDRIVTAEGTTPRRHETWFVLVSRDRILRI